MIVPTNLCVSPYAAGQEVVLPDGRAATITSVVSTEIPEGVEVYNLTVADGATYFVDDGQGEVSAVWVHNSQAFGRVLVKLYAKPKALLKGAKALGRKASYVHAHHLVQKSYNIILARRKHTFNWYIRESQKILKTHDVPLLKKLSEAKKLADAKKPLYNLRWAYNGQGTHSLKTVKAVYEALSKAKNQRGVIIILNRLAKKFESGQKLF